MYKKLPLDDLKHLKKSPPENISLWLSEEVIDYLKLNYCQDDLHNIQEILYRDFLKKNKIYSKILEDSWARQMFKNVQGITFKKRYSLK